MGPALLLRTTAPGLRAGDSIKKRIDIFIAGDWKALWVELTDFFGQLDSVTHPGREMYISQPCTPDLNLPLLTRRQEGSFPDPDTRKRAEFEFKRASKLVNNMTKAIKLLPCPANDVATTTRFHFKERGLQKALSQIVHHALFEKFHTEYLDNSERVNQRLFLPTRPPKRPHSSPPTTSCPPTPY